jgi:hypothetical protein
LGPRRQMDLEEEARRYGAIERYEPSSCSEYEECSTEEEEDDDEEVVQWIDNDSWFATKQFYEKDGDVMTCRRRQKEEMDSYDCSVAWWYEAPDTRPFPLHNLVGFNEPNYMRAILDLLWRAQDYLNHSRLVVFYYERDMGAWMKRTRQADAALPFGVIVPGEREDDDADKPVGQLSRVKAAGSFNWQLQFRCHSEKKRRRYAFFVFDRDATFQDVVEPDAHERVRRERECEKTRNLEKPQLWLNSPFIDLYFKDWEWKETNLYAGDANKLATHPESFLQTKQLPLDPLEDLPEEVTYTLDSLAVTKAREQAPANREKRQTVAAQRWIAQQKCGNGKGKRKGFASQDISEQWVWFRDGGNDDDSDCDNETLYESREREFNRTSMKKELKPLPASMQIVRGPPPQILIKPEEKKREYEDAVCHLMNFPFLFFKPHTNLSGNRAALSPSEIDFSQSQLNKSIALQQKTFQLMFDELYGRTFALLDATYFGTLGEGAERFTRHIKTRLTFSPPGEREKELQQKELAAPVQHELQRLLTQGGLADGPREAGGSARKRETGKRKRGNEKETINVS